MTNAFSGFDRHIGKLLGELPPRFRSIVKRRFGIGGSSRFTLEAIGTKEGITRERVRQIENDAIRRLKKSPVFSEGKAYESALRAAVEKLGGVVSEEMLLLQPELDGIKDKNSVLFFLDVSDELQYKKSDDLLYARWYTKDAPIAKIESALRALVEDLGSSKQTLGEADLYAELAGHLRKAGVGDLRTNVLATYVALSPHIERNTWGEYGHVASPFIRPRGMRESAYVALSRAGEPLHFRDIANRITEFAGRKVHVQTVHNELIKDDRFVLVGRGLYALREWGYEPGFVKDVLVQLLSSKGPMSRETILKEVSRVRQVKPSTVLINLQNKKLFRMGTDGTYTLVS